MAVHRTGVVHLLVALFMASMLPSLCKVAGKQHFLLVQHQIYEEHQEVLSPSASNGGQGFRKDDDELFHFIKEYLYKQGGVDKLRGRNQGGAAQFMGVDMGGEPQGESGGNTSERRYKMHLIKFRLANASDIALAKGPKVQSIKGANKKSNLVIGPKQLAAEASHGVHNTSTTLGDFVYIRLNASSSETTAFPHVHVNASAFKTTAVPSNHVNTTTSFGTTAVPLPHTRTNTSPSRTYKTTHPTHATPVDKLLLLKAVPQDGCGRNVAASKATTATTKATTTAATTTKRTTPTTTTATTTTTTPRPTTTSTTHTTRRKTSTAKTPTTHTLSTKASTTTAAPTTCGEHTTVKAVNCFPVLVPRTTPKPMLHGHPYLVIKVHEERRDQGVSSKPHTRLETVQVHANASQHKGKRHEWPPDENVGEADTESLKHQMEGNLLSMLRTIRELDRLANGSRRAPPPMVLGPNIEIDRVLVDRSRDGRPSWLRPTRRHEADELDEDEAEEGDLHRFNLLLRQALNQLQHSTRKPVS